MADKTELHEERLIPESMDDLRGRTPEELRQMLEVLDAHLKSPAPVRRGRAPRPVR